MVGEGWETLPILSISEDAFHVNLIQVKQGEGGSS